MTKIDLNKWERVSTEQDTDGYQSLVITPFKLQDGTQPPNLYFRKGKKKETEIEDVENITWNKELRISKEGGDDEYANRVDWWYEQAAKDEEYRQLINNSFNKNGFDVKKAWAMSQNYLKKFTYSARKTYLHKYIWNWMINGMHQHMRFKK